MQFSVIIEELEKRQNNSADETAPPHPLVHALTRFCLNKKKNETLAPEDLLKLAGLFFDQKAPVHDKKLKKSIDFLWRRLIMACVGSSAYFSHAIELPLYINAYQYRIEHDTDPNFRYDFINSLGFLYKEGWLSLDVFEAFSFYYETNTGERWKPSHMALQKLAKEGLLSSSNLMTIYQSPYSSILEVIKRLKDLDVPLDQTRLSLLCGLREQDRQFFVFVLERILENRWDSTAPNEELLQFFDLLAAKHFHCPVNQLELFFTLNTLCNMLSLEKLKLLLNPEINSKAVVYKVIDLARVLSREGDEALTSQIVSTMLADITLWGLVCDALKDTEFYAFSNTHNQDKRSCWFKLQSLVSQIKAQNADLDRDSLQELKAYIKTQVAKLSAPDTRVTLCFQDVQDVIQDYHTQRQAQGLWKLVTDMLSPYTLISKAGKFCQVSDPSKALSESSRFALAQIILSDDSSGYGDTFYKIKSSLQKKLIAACTAVNIEPGSVQHLHFFDNLKFMQRHQLLNADSFVAFVTAATELGSDVWVTMNLVLSVLEKNDLMNSKNLLDLFARPRADIYQVLYLLDRAEMPINQADFDNLLSLSENNLKIFEIVSEKIELRISALKLGHDKPPAPTQQSAVQFLNDLSQNQYSSPIRAEELDHCICLLSQYTDMLEMDKLACLMRENITCTKVANLAPLFDMLSKLKDQTLMDEAIQTVLSDIDNWVDVCQQELNYGLLLTKYLQEDEEGIDACWQLIQTRVREQPYHQVTETSGDSEPWVKVLSNVPAGDLQLPFISKGRSNTVIPEQGEVTSLRHSM